MPTELGWRPADGNMGGFDAVNDQNPLPVAVMRTSPYYPQPFTYPLAGSVAILLKNAQGFLNSLIATNVNAAIRYLQIFNQTTVPATGNVPVISLPIPAGSATVPGQWTLGDDFLGKDGLFLSAGIAIGVSTTAATFTAATATEHTVNGTFT